MEDDAAFVGNAPRTLVGREHSLSQRHVKHPPERIRQNSTHTGASRTSQRSHVREESEREGHWAGRGQRHPPRSGERGEAPAKAERR